MFIIEKYAKIRFKNRGPPCYFLDVKISKILQKVEQKAFVYLLDFIFHGLSRARTDLHNEYMFNFVSGSFFEQDRLLNFFNLEVYAKR